MRNFKRGDIVYIQIQGSGNEYVGVVTGSTQDMDNWSDVKFYRCKDGVWMYAPSAMDNRRLHYLGELPSWTEWDV
jgi:hypothetical protein